MSRRQMLASSVVAVGGLYFLRSKFLPQTTFSPNLILGSAIDLPNEQFENGATYAEPTRGEIVSFNVRTNEMSRLQVPFFAHGFSFTSRYDLAVASQKWSALGAAIDLRSGRVARLITAPKGKVFFGHSCFDFDDKFCFMAAQDTTGNGHILTYDTARFELQNSVDLGRRTHEVRIFDKDHLIFALSDTAMLPSNGAICIFNFRSGKVAKMLNSKPASHLMPLEDGRFIFSGHTPNFKAAKPHNVPFLLHVDPLTGQIHEQPFGAEYQLRGEALSITRLSEKCLIATIPGSDRLIIWNFERNRLTQMMLPNKPSAILQIGINEFVVNDRKNQLHQMRFLENENRLVQAGETRIDVANGRHAYSLPV